LRAELVDFTGYLDGPARFLFRRSRRQARATHLQQASALNRPKSILRVVMIVFAVSIFRPIPSGALSACQPNVPSLRSILP